MLDDTNDKHEFRPLLAEIEDAPLNPLGRTVFWIIMAALLFFALWTFFGRIDVVVTARGKVIPDGEVKTVQPLNTGVVRSIRAQVGDLVEEGQVLMEIDPSDIDPELTSMRTETQQVELARLRIEALLGGTEFRPPAGYNPVLTQVQTDLYLAARERLESQLWVKRQEYQQIESQIAAQEKTGRQADERAKQIARRLDRMEAVHDLISRDELEQIRIDAGDAETVRANAIHGLDELRAGLLRIDREIALLRDEERSRLLSELADNRLRQTYLSGSIEQAEYRSRRQQITSPVKGHVAQLLFHTVGGVVSPAEKLAVIVPLDSPLLIKALVSSRDVGFIAPGMKVSLKIDTFEFQKYGIIDGELTHVSKDSIEDQYTGLMYETLVRPERISLMVDGQETDIANGMGVTAEIKVGKRRIIEFFIYPIIRYLNEGIKVR
jgi:hemolysin D